MRLLGVYQMSEYEVVVFVEGNMTFENHFMKSLLITVWYMIIVFLSFL